MEEKTNMTTRVGRVFLCVTQLCTFHCPRRETTFCQSAKCAAAPLLCCYTGGVHSQVRLFVRVYTPPPLLPPSVVSIHNELVPISPVRNTTAGCCCSATSERVYMYEYLVLEMPPSSLPSRAQREFKWNIHTIQVGGWRSLLRCD